MKLRSGKLINKFFNKNEQPFKLILLPEKVKKEEV